MGHQEQQPLGRGSALFAERHGLLGLGDSEVSAPP